MTTVPRYNPARKTRQSFVNTNYSILSATDCLGTYFVIQPDWAAEDAMREGFTLHVTGLPIAEAKARKADLQDGTWDTLDYARAVAS